MSCPISRYFSRIAGMKHLAASLGFPVALAAALAATLLAGCSLISTPWKRQPPPPPPVVIATPPPAPALPLPVATHKFTLTTDDDVVGVLQLTIASKEDTLPDIARRFNVGYEEIVRANPGVDPWVPGADRKIVVPTRFVLPNAPHEGVVINLAAMRIYYYPKHAKGEPQLVYTHPIGVGKVGWQTPEGVTKIISREKDPTWRPSAGVRKEHAANDDPVPAVVPPGPDNPLGKYKFTLGWPSYLIHGTNKPYGVGLRSSHGCIRLYPEDIEKFYQAVPLGTPVRVVNQPFLFGWHEGQLYLQLTHAPRGLVVPVSTQAGGSVETVLATAPVVQNRIPEGANWNGADEVDGDAQSFQQLLSEREPQATQATPASNAAAVKPQG